MRTRLSMNPALEMRDFRLVDVVLRLGSLNKAATALGRTPSALSHQLAELERRIGASLFTRVGKRLVPTALALGLHPHARAVLAESRRAEERVAGRGAAHETLRLTTECYSCYTWLAPVMRQFRTLHPDVRIDLRTRTTLSPRDALLAGRVDVALVCSADEDRRLRYWPVFADELVAIVSPDHEWTQRGYVSARALAAEHLIVAPVAKGRGRLGPLFAAAGVTPRSVTRIPMTEAILEMAREEIGVGIVPRWAARTYLSAGLVRSIRITRNGLNRDWRAAARRAPKTPAYLGDFIEIIGRTFPGGDVVRAID